MKRKVLTILFCLSIITTIEGQKNLQEQWVDSVMTLINPDIIYDPAYVRLDYPNGDVDENKGVCSDVVIRAYRKMGFDLQRLVHEDMRKHFNLYPQKWGLQRADKNIDHRRVPNLMAFFARFGTVLTKSVQASDYHPGEIVCWDLGGGITHIGIVSRVRSQDGLRYLILHNIGGGQVLEDCLFRFTIIGHYAYYPWI